MNINKRDIILIGPLKPVVVKGLEAVGTIYKAAEAKDIDAFFASHRDIRAIACSATTEYIGEQFMGRFPKLRIISSFGVGYDHIDAKWAGAHGIIVTSTPEVLTEEVADTALALLLCTVRKRSRGGSTLSACRWSITRAARGRASPTDTIRSFSIWRATSTR